MGFIESVVEVIQNHEAVLSGAAAALAIAGIMSTWCVRLVRQTGLVGHMPLANFSDRIKALPSGINRLVALERLYVEENGLCSVPPEIGSSPAMQFRSVDLPHPEGPTSTRKSPGSIETLISFRISIGP